DWDLLLVDDGSNDGSTGIAEEYATKYPERVRYITHKCHINQGIAASRNLGVSMARGEYIAFLDADDVFLPMKLSAQMRYLHRNAEVDVIYGRPLYWHSWSSSSYYRDSIPTIGAYQNIVVQPPALLLQNSPLGRVSAPCPSDLIVRRKFFEQVGGSE